jgi:hypothetical protein
MISLIEKKDFMLQKTNSKLKVIIPAFLAFYISSCKMGKEYQRP